MESANDIKENTKKEWNDIYWKFVQKENENAEEEVDTSRTWKDVPWDAAREQAAKELIDKAQYVPQEEREKYELDAPNYWEKFYQCNKTNFFKDRHYLHRHFPMLELEEGQSKLKGKVVVEIGCGVGNTFFPLLKEHPESFFYALDFSSTAISLLKSNPLFEANRCKAFVCDISKGLSSGVLENIPPASVDIILMIFVLSALSPRSMSQALDALLKLLKPGGFIFFRDYGLYDMTQVRFLAKQKPRKLGDNYYVRADGTSTYYFTPESLKELFTNAGFTTSYIYQDTRELMNRKRCIKMYRVWITGVFIKPEI